MVRAKFLYILTQYLAKISDLYFKKSILFYNI